MYASASKPCVSQLQRATSPCSSAGTNSMSPPQNICSAVKVIRSSAGWVLRMWMVPADQQKQPNTITSAGQIEATAASPPPGKTIRLVPAKPATRPIATRDEIF